MEEIKQFFGTTWNQTEVDDHVVDRIINAKSVIDVGCGFNPYKKFNHNLVGVDLINEEADENCDILDFDTMGCKYDVAICYGILHFNSYDWIRERLEWVVNNTKPKSEILIKVNPSRKEDQAEAFTDQLKQSEESQIRVSKATGKPEANAAIIINTSIVKNRCSII